MPSLSLLFCLFSGFQETLAFDSDVVDTTPGCDTSAVPVYTLIGVIGLWLSLYILLSALDVYQSPFFKTEANRSKPKRQSAQLPAEPAPIELNQLSPLSESSSQSSSEPGAVEGGESGGYCVKQENFAAHFESPVLLEKTTLGLCCDQHLTLGLFNYRYKYPRSTRVATVLSVWLFLLVGIGLVFTLVEDDDSSSDDLFSTYELRFLFYGLLVVAVSVPYTLTLICLLSNARDASCCPNVLGLSIAMGVIYLAMTAVVFMSSLLCAQKSGYWILTYFCVLPFEILVVETVYMLLRYCCLRKTK